MPAYMFSPQIKVTVTHSGTDYSFLGECESIVVTRRENAWDIATVQLNDDKGKNYSVKVSGGDAITIEVKDEGDASWTLIFKGIINVCLPNLPPDSITLKCDGAGYGLGNTLCGGQYGTQSTLPTLDTLREILTNASQGILTRWLERILGQIGTSSGYAYDQSVQDIAGSIKYLYFPYKPCDKAVNDVCEIVQAIKGTNAGPHWLVIPKSGADDYFVLTTIGDHDANAVAQGWTTYYGGSQSAATLEQEKDFQKLQFQELDEEANYVLVYGTLKKPATELWTENNSALWDYIATGGGAGAGIADDSTVYKVGSYSLKCTTDDGSPSGGINVWYPSAKNAGWDITKWGGPYAIPKFNFYMRRDAHIQNFLMKPHTDLTHYFIYNLLGSLGTAGKWFAFDLPIGPHAQEHTMGDEVTFSDVGGDWTNINYIQFTFGSDNGNAVAWVDDVFFSGKVARAAKNSTRITANKLKPILITDDMGKDDSGVASDDTGTLARLAKAQLLRSQTTPLVGMFTVSMLKDLLPGQLLHIHAKKVSDSGSCAVCDGSGTFRIAKDMRVTQLIHRGNAKIGLFTDVYVTDDVKNSRARSPYNELNKVLANVRPEFQDRQATSIKTRDLDITVPILEVDYPS